MSLIQDQVQQLVAMEVPACSMTGMTSAAQIARISEDLEGMCAGWKDERSVKLLYVTPEKIAHSNQFRRRLDALFRKDLLARIVIDEAHCISQWGHDFRPDYKVFLTPPPPALPGKSGLQKCTRSCPTTIPRLNRAFLPLKILSNDNLLVKR